MNNQSRLNDDKLIIIEGMIQALKEIRRKTAREIRWELRCQRDIHEDVFRGFYKIKKKDFNEIFKRYEEITK